MNLWFRGDTSKVWVDKGLRGQRSGGCERALRRPSWLYSWKEFRPELGLLYWEWKENGRNCKPGFMFALQHPYSHPFPLLHSPSQLMIPSSFIGNSSPNHWVGLYTSMYLCVSLSPSFLLLGCKNSPYRRSAPPLCSSKGFLFFMIPWSCIISLSLFNIHLSVLFDSPCLLKFQVMLRFSLPITSFIVKLLQVLSTHTASISLSTNCYSVCCNLAHGIALLKLLFILYHPNHSGLFSGLILVFLSCLAHLTPPSFMKYSF